MPLRRKLSKPKPATKKKETTIPGTKGGRDRDQDRGRTNAASGSIPISQSSGPAPAPTSTFERGTERVGAGLITTGDRDRDRDRDEDEGVEFGYGNGNEVGVGHGIGHGYDGLIGSGDEGEGEGEGEGDSLLGSRFTESGLGLGAGADAGTTRQFSTTSSSRRHGRGLEVEADASPNGGSVGESGSGIGIADNDDVLNFIPVPESSTMSHVPPARPRPSLGTRLFYLGGRDDSNKRQSSRGGERSSMRSSITVTPHGYGLGVRGGSMYRASESYVGAGPGMDVDGDSDTGTEVGMGPVYETPLLSGSMEDLIDAIGIGRASAMGSVSEFGTGTGTEGEDADADGDESSVSVLGYYSTDASGNYDADTDNALITTSPDPHQLTRHAPDPFPNQDLQIHPWHTSRLSDTPPEGNPHSISGNQSGNRNRAHLGSGGGGGDESRLTRTGGTRTAKGTLTSNAAANPDLGFTDSNLDLNLELGWKVEPFGYGAWESDRKEGSASPKRSSASTYVSTSNSASTSTSTSSSLSALSAHGVGSAIANGNGRTRDVIGKPSEGSTGLGVSVTLPLNSNSNPNRHAAKGKGKQKIISSGESAVGGGGRIGASTIEARSSQSNANVEGDGISDLSKTLIMANVPDRSVQNVNVSVPQKAGDTDTGIDIDNTPSPLSGQDGRVVAQPHSSQGSIEHSINTNSARTSIDSSRPSHSITTPTLASTTKILTPAPAPITTTNNLKPDSRSPHTSPNPSTKSKFTKNAHRHRRYPTFTSSASSLSGLQIAMVSGLGTGMNTTGTGTSTPGTLTGTSTPGTLTGSNTPTPMTTPVTGAGAGTLTLNDSALAEGYSDGYFTLPSALGHGHGQQSLNDGDGNETLTITKAQMRELLMLKAQAQARRASLPTHLTGGGSRVGSMAGGGGGAVNAHLPYQSVISSLANPNPNSQSQLAVQSQSQIQNQVQENGTSISTRPSTATTTGTRTGNGTGNGMGTRPPTRERDSMAAPPLMRVSIDSYGHRDMLRVRSSTVASVGTTINGQGQGQGHGRTGTTTTTTSTTTTTATALAARRNLRRLMRPRKSTALREGEVVSKPWLDIALQNRVSVFSLLGLGASSKSKSLPLSLSSSRSQGTPSPPPPQLVVVDTHLTSRYKSYALYTFLSRLTTYFFILLGFVGAAAWAWNGVRSTKAGLFAPGELCVVLDEEFLGGGGSGGGGQGGVGALGLDESVWEVEVRMDGYGNGEFEMTTASPNNTFVRDGVLYLVPTLTSDVIGRASVLDGFVFNLTGCTADVPQGFNLTSLSNSTSTSTSNSSSTPNDDNPTLTGPPTSPSNTGTALTPLQSYLAACSAVSNRTAQTVINPVMSSRISTRGKKSVRYGRVEVRARLPVGDWLWPAIWMLPENDTYGSWPLSGEIDIVESRGNGISYTKQGSNFVRASLNWGPTVFLNAVAKTFGWWTDRRKSFADEFHTYVLEWDEKYIRSYVDTRLHQMLEIKFKESFFERGDFPDVVFNGTNEVVLQNPWNGRGNSAPFDQPFYLIMDVAVGGTNGWFPDNAGNKPWLDASQDAMLNFANAQDTWYATWPLDVTRRGMAVDYVKMWQKCDAAP